MERNGRTEVELLIFDLDGTLVDSAAEIAASVNSALTAIDLAPVSLESVRNWVGHGARSTVRRALAARAPQLDAAAIDARMPRLMELYARAHAHHCGTDSRLFPGVAETLARLGDAGMPMALVTNKEARFVRPVLRQHGLDGYFDPVVAGDSLPECKPHPLPIWHCQQHHGTPLERCVLVGDSSVDAQAARAAGVRFWAVPYGYNGGRPIMVSPPDSLLADFSAVLEVLSAGDTRARA